MVTRKMLSTLRLRFVLLFLACLAGFGADSLIGLEDLFGPQAGQDPPPQSSEQDPPPERVVLPDQPIPKRTSDQPSAPEVEAGEMCGAEVINGFEQPSLDRPYQRESVTFSLQVKDEVIPYRLMSILVMPGQKVEIEAVFSNKGSKFTACTLDGALTRLDPDEWSWKAPSTPGVYSLYFTEVHSDATMRLQALVLEPYAGGDRFHGFRIGKYERVPLKNNPKYNTPTGLIRVTPEMEDLWLSPHFQLRQFLCKQEGGYPKFVLVHERLLLKLELLLEKMNMNGLEANTFAVLSGYRTPFYNRAIGNSTRYSRHVYGDAADIYIDRDHDGRMDDLNGDGKSNRADAKLMAEIINQSYQSIWYKPYIGGLGLYGAKPHRGPFIHVDTRGFKARW